MVLTPDGRYVFLEINPNGQYLWIEKLTGLPISDAVSDLLISGEATLNERNIRTNGNRYVGVPDDDRPGRDEAGDCEVRPAAIAEGSAPVGMQLLWEEETYDNRIHYDALLNLPEEGTISISFCDDRATPWPLRGVHRWSDADLVRVNNNVLSVDQAIACLDFMWDEARIAERLEIQHLPRPEQVSTTPIDLSDEEFQQAMDGFRRARGLYKAARILAAGWSGEA